MAESISVRRIASLDGVVGDKAAFDLDDLGRLAKLHPLAKDAYDDGPSIGVGKAHNPVWDVAITPEKGLMLGDDPPEEFLDCSRCPASRLAGRATWSEAAVSAPSALCGA